MDKRNKGKNVVGIFAVYVAVSLMFAYSIFIANRTFMPCLMITIGCASVTFVFTYISKDKIILHPWRYLSVFLLLFFATTCALLLVLECFRP